MTNSIAAGYSQTVTDFAFEHCWGHSHRGLPRGTENSSHQAAAPSNVDSSQRALRDLTWWVGVRERQWAEEKKQKRVRETTCKKKKKRLACKPAPLSANDRWTSLVIDMITTESHARLSAHWKYCGPGVDLINLILSCVSHMSVQVQASGLKKTTTLKTAHDCLKIPQRRSRQEWRAHTERAHIQIQVFRSSVEVS